MKTKTNPKYAWLFCLIPLAASWMYDFPQILSIPLQQELHLKEYQVLY